MRGGNPVTSRPAWYDRNPVSQGEHYTSAQVGPHAETTRQTYTVPAATRTRVTTGNVSVQRDNASTALGDLEAWVEVTPSGGAAFRACSVILRNNGVNLIASAQFTGLDLGPGDTLALKTSDDSTGGSAAYSLAWAGTEYNQ